MEPAPNTSNDRLWLFAILALALVLRIVGLNQPLWYDEVLTITSHLRLPWQEMMQEYSMNHHYGFSLLAKLSMSLFGDAPWVVRLPAMLFGVGSIWVMWHLARLVADSKIAHITALLLALSYHHIWFSQNARGYTEMAFWATLGTFLFLKGLNTPRLSTWIGYGVVLMLTVFTHLTGAFVFVAHGVIWLGYLGVRAYKKSFQKTYFTLPFIGFLVGGILTLLVYAPILMSLITTMGEISGTSAVDEMQEYQNPIWTVMEGVRTAIGAAGPLVGVVAIAVMGLCVIGATAAHKKAPLFGPIVLAHIVLTLLILVTLGMRVWPRFFFVDIGFLLLLIVLGVRAVCTGLARLPIPGLDAARWFLLATIAMVIVSSALASRNYGLPKQNLAGAVELVDEIRKPGERVLAIGHAGTAFEDYFNTNWESIMTPQDYAAAMAQPGPVLIVVAFPQRNFRSIPALQKDREQSLSDVKEFYGTLGDGGVVVLQRD